MPYDNVPETNAPALPSRVDDYAFAVDIHGTLPDGTPRSTIDDLDIFSPDGGATNTKLLDYLDRVVVEVRYRGEVLTTVDGRVEGVRGKRIPFAVLKRLMQAVDAAMKQAGNAGN